MKVHTWKGLVVIVATAVALGGCTLAKIGGRGATPVMLNNPPAKVEVIQHFKVSKSIRFDYTKSYDASDILAEVLAKTKADAIINVAFTVKTTPADYFINVCTLGIAQAQTLEVSGDAVKAPQGLGSLLVPGSEVLAESEHLDSLTPILVEHPSTDGASMMIARVQGEEGRIAYQLVRFKEEVSDL